MDLQLIEDLQTTNKQIFLLINKVDLVTKESILPVIDAYRSTMDFSAILPISALDGDNVDALLKMTIDCSTEEPALFP